MNRAAGSAVPPVMLIPLPRWARRRTPHDADDAATMSASCGYWRIEPASGEKQICLLPRDHVGRGHSPIPDPSDPYEYEDEDGLDGPGVVGESGDRLPWLSTSPAAAGPAVGPEPAAMSLRFDLATRGREENPVVADPRTDFIEVPRDLAIANSARNQDGARAQDGARPALGPPPTPLAPRPAPMLPPRDSADHRPATPPPAAPTHPPGPRPLPARTHPPVPEHLAIALASRRAVDLLTWTEQPADPESAAAPGDRAPLRQRVNLVLPPEQVRYTPTGLVRVELVVRVVPYQRCPTPAHRRSPPYPSTKVVHCSGWIEQDGRWERLVLWVAYDAAGKLAAKGEDEQADDSGPTGDR